MPYYLFIINYWWNHLVIFLYKNKTQEAKTKLITTTVTIASHFILLTFSSCLCYGTIDIGKCHRLPMYPMSVMCFVVRHNKNEVFKTAFTLLGLIGGLCTYLSRRWPADG